MTDKKAMAKELEELAGRFSEGWHEGIKIDASDIMLLSQAAEVLAQPEQEPVAVVDVHEFYDNCANFSLLQKLPKGKHTLYTTPPQRNPLTDEQRQELMSKAWNKWLSRKDDGCSFAWDFSFEVEAAHGIKENT